MSTTAIRDAQVENLNPGELFLSPGELAKKRADRWMQTVSLKDS